MTSIWNMRVHSLYEAAAECHRIYVEAKDDCRHTCNAEWGLDVPLFLGKGHARKQYLLYWVSIVHDTDRLRVV